MYDNSIHARSAECVTLPPKTEHRSRHFAARETNGHGDALLSSSLTSRYCFYCLETITTASGTLTLPWVSLFKSVRCRLVEICSFPRKADFSPQHRIDRRLLLLPRVACLHHCHAIEVFYCIDTISAASATCGFLSSNFGFRNFILGGCTRRFSLVVGECSFA